MSDFDRFLEFELRQMLDPVVASEAPRRARRKTYGPTLVAIVTAPIEAVKAPSVQPIQVVR